MNCIARELVVKIKILVILAMSFAVLSCKKRAVLTDPGGPKDHEHPGQEMQAYPKFEFAYKAWLVAASDGGVIGISVELYNLSGNTPLKLRSAGDCIPIGVVIRDRNNPLGKGLVGVGGIKLHSAPATTVAQPSEKKPNVIWAIPPLSARRYYIPLRYFSNSLPESDQIGPCDLSVVVNAFPESLPEVMFEHPFVPLYFGPVLITKQALEMDPETALRESLKASGDVDETHFIKPN